MPLIEVQNLTFRYALSDADSLGGINLSVDEGEFCLIFGASGCGKTTLLRHFKNELTPSGCRSGQVLFRGGDISKLSPASSACEIGLVMQNPDSQIVTDVVWHELAFGLENLGFDSDVIRRRVSEMASFFGIGSWFHKKTAELSGGQKQLLNLASVLVMQPRLLLLDEPTSQLDPIAAREFTDMVIRLNRELGMTIIMTEHRLEEVLPVATRTILIENGLVKYNLPPRELPAILIKNGDTGYLDYLPAAAKIFARSQLSETQCPLTVREGRTHLTKLIGEKKITESQNTNTIKNIMKSETPKTLSGNIDDKRKSAVECKDVFFKYAKDSPDVLSGLSLRVNYGEVLCILGENGSGKSTLLQIIAGLLLPARGNVKISGKSIRSFTSKELYCGNIGLLPQNPKAIFLHDTLRADLGDGALQIATKLGIEKLLDRHPYDLSGGEQQKAALARVLLTNPRILLLDEPTKGLDVKAKDELALILKQLCNDGVCLIISTHDIEFAAVYATRCLMLFDGNAASDGKTRSFFSGNCFYTTPANHIARDFDSGALTCEDVVKLCDF